MQNPEQQLSDTRPKEWESGQYFGATTALDYELITPGVVIDEDVVAVQNQAFRQHSAIQWSDSKEKNVEMGDFEGGLAFAAGALVAICETLDRKVERYSTH